MKWRLIIEGTGVRMKVDDGPPKKISFLQSHWIEADDVESAFKIATEKIHDDKQFLNSLAEESWKNLKLTIDDYCELDDFESVDANPSGYVFCLDNYS